jgi:hypothetical protein
LANTVEFMNRTRKMKVKNTLIMTINLGYNVVINI